MGDATQIPKSDGEWGTLSHFCWMPRWCVDLDPILLIVVSGDGANLKVGGGGGHRSSAK